MAMPSLMPLMSGLTKSQVGVAVSGSNFGEDANTNGVIKSVDVAQVKAKVGTALP